MYQLKIGETVIAKSSTPFTFDDEHCLWTSADYRLYDHSRVVEQIVDDEHAGTDFQRSSALVVLAPVVTPTQFKRLFTGPEGVAIKKARGSDDLIEDFFSLVDDPGLVSVDLGLQSTLDVLTQLEEMNIITPQRRAVILAGQPQ